MVPDIMLTRNPLTQAIDACSSFILADELQSLASKMSLCSLARPDADNIAVDSLLLHINSILISSLAEKV
jgi:hypothetical protein